jgi:hypothetical protein
MPDHLAFKCTWHDGGPNGFEGTCSDENMRINVTSKNKRVWCSQRENACYQFVHGLTRDYPHLPCYESRLFTAWSMGFGVIHNGPHQGEPIAPAGDLGAGSIGVLTSRPPGTPEEKRAVIRIHYYSGEPYQWDEGGSFYIDADPALSFRLPTSARLLFWKYYQNPNTDSIIWGSGLYCWLSTDQVDKLLRDIRRSGPTPLRQRADALLRRLIFEDQVDEPSNIAIVVTKYPTGESEAHKRLKRWVYEHPRALGIRPTYRQMEYSFITGDRADVVLVAGEDAAVAVEIELSGELECLVGLHQAIKYRALLAAERGLAVDSTKVRSALVAYEVPDPIKAIATFHGVTVIEVPQP